MDARAPWQHEEFVRYTLWFVYACVIYSIIGFSWGALMGGIHEFRHFVDQRMFGKLIVRAHTHINLLGWVEMAIFAAVYYIVPRLAQRAIYSVSLVKWHFWIHNFGLLGMVICFSMAGWVGGTTSVAFGPEAAEQAVRPWLRLVGIFGSLVLLANFIWAYNIFRTCFAKEEAR